MGSLPWQADWYRRKVEDVEGQHVDEIDRLWYVDKANHMTRQRRG